MKNDDSRGAFLTYAFCLLRFALTPTSAQMIVRDAPPAAPIGVGTAAVSGTVVSDESSPQPIARVRVEISVDGGAPKTGYTDGEGRFVFSAIPAGRYSIAASKPAYVRGNYGAKRPNRPGTPVTVADGQQVTGLQIRLARGAVITGTIRDEMGQPAPVSTCACCSIECRTATDAPARAVSEQRRRRTTDDRGIYRLAVAGGRVHSSSLAAGARFSDVRQITAADLSPFNERASRDPIRRRHRRRRRHDRYLRADVLSGDAGAGERRGRQRRRRRGRPASTWACSCRARRASKAP